MTTSGSSTERELLARLDAKITLKRGELRELETARKVLAELIGPPKYEVAGGGGKVDREPAPPVHLDGGPGRVSGTATSPPPGLSAPGLGVVEAAAIVLRHLGRPQGAEGIARAMLAGGYKYDKPLLTLRRTVRGVLGREIREEGDTPFRKEARGLYGLKEWGPIQAEPEAPLFETEEEEEDRQESEAAERE